MKGKLPKGGGMGLRAAIIVVLVCLSGCGGGGKPVSDSQGTTYTDPAALSPLITSSQQAEQPGEWTILIYLDADNDLEYAGMLNINQMETVGSTKDVRIIVQVDRAPGYDATCGDWTDTRRYLITRDASKAIVGSIRLDETPLGELNMANPNTLRNFITWGKANFPANHYCLIIWDHGTGWQFRSQSMLPQYKYVISDDTSSSGMNIDEVRQAVTGLGLDVIAFDACLMQQLEVAYEIKDAANYMVGSATSEPSPGYDYSTLLYRIYGTTQPADLCREIVNCYVQAYPPPKTAITQCALDLSMIGDVADAASAYAQVLIDQSASLTGFEVARAQSLNYAPADSGNRSYVDLVDYCGRCADVIGSDAQAAYDNLAAAVTAATVAEAHSLDLLNSCGIGVYVPPSDFYDTKYSRLLFAADTAWDEWLKSSRQ